MMDVLQAENERLKAENDALKSENDTFKKFTNDKAEEIIKETTVDNNGAHVILKHPMFALFNIMLTDAWVADGCQNFYEILLSSPKIGNVIVTLQKVDGKTPTQIISELRSELAALKEAQHKDPFQMAEDELKKYLSDNGYDYDDLRRKGKELAAALKNLPQLSEAE
jgi:hypothetical protein